MQTEYECNTYIHDIRPAHFNGGPLITSLNSKFIYLVQDFVSLKWIHVCTQEYK